MRTSRGKQRLLLGAHLGFGHKQTLAGQEVSPRPRVADEEDALVLKEGAGGQRRGQG